MSNPPRRRRQRTVFHYKVDEGLKPADREPYLLLLHDLRTRIDDAHRWLLERGYQLSRSAVARHRRRLLAGEQKRATVHDQALAFARLAGGESGPDFAAAAVCQLQHIVFRRLLELSGNGHLLKPPGEDLNGSADRVGGGDDDPPPPVTAKDLLDLGKLVAQCIELTSQRVRAFPEQTSATPSASQKPPQSDEALRKRIEDIVLRGA